MPERHEVRFVEREDCCPDIASFRFTKPEDYSFAAGQFGVYTLDTAGGPQSKPFTHSQAPGDSYLEITTRLSGSAYKNALVALAPGDPVQLQGPGGRLTLSADITRVAFLIGGVGVTPARSILRDAVQRQASWDDAVVFYGNRDEGCIPFRSELESMGDRGVRLVNVIERPTPDWAGETGFVSADVVRRHLDARDERPFCVSGPPPMVAAMERVMDELGIDAARRMIERFGASPWSAEG